MMIPPDPAPDNPAANNEPPPRSASLLAAELQRIAECFLAADRRAKRVTNIANRDAAELERPQAAGEFRAAEIDMADLFCLLLRLAVQYQADAVGLYLAEALHSELKDLAEAVARLEARQ
jgi:hypothetical protein